MDLKWRAEVEEQPARKQMNINKTTLILTYLISLSQQLGYLYQSVISGSLTLRDTKIRNFGDFEWSLSCSVFSYQLKTKREKSEHPSLQSRESA